MIYTAVSFAVGMIHANGIRVGWEAMSINEWMLIFISANDIYRFVLLRWLWVGLFSVYLSNGTSYESNTPSALTSVIFSLIA